jgi:tetratricopeptide (TPR) repeat protein
MNTYSSSLRRLIPLTTVLITMNSVLGMVPLVIFPNVSQPVQAQESSTGIMEVGLLQYSLGNYQDAIQNFTNAIYLSPNNPENYLLRGLSYLLSEKFEQAKEDFDYAIRISPHNSTAYSLRGVSSVFLGVTEAQKDLQKSITLLQQQGNFSQAKELESYLKELKEEIESGMMLFRNQSNQSN